MTDPTPTVGLEEGFVRFINQASVSMHLQHPSADGIATAIATRMLDLEVARLANATERLADEQRTANLIEVMKGRAPYDHRLGAEIEKRLGLTDPSQKQEPTP